ncbi:rhomboid family intramembrane serine protease [Pseudoponticoccus marisrubri]|uniref:Rhomboid family intramembrane serine protease n=1 Tax=Pseudoponticoccus marisrubri TaxID=1685382 RepID=A0A0W7WFE5_9RHOB|nr:rhomboid family intramembrane serine protease [Pseudoponticoccus marisrubri]KUF09247.1 rhomboid family intramembrane serine protease [Pseudoponticoccus marisrubri]
MTHPHQETPVNPMPPVVVALFLVLAGIEGAFALADRGLLGGAGGVGWRIEALNRFGFSGRVMDWMLQTGQTPAEHLVRFLAYPFVHASFSHALFAMVILLAMGKLVAESLGTLAFVAIFMISALAGALAYGLLLDDPRLLVGAYPPVYGLIGGYTFLLWTGLGAMGQARYRAFTLIGFLLGIQLIFGVLFGGGSDWVADVAGFATGFFLSFLFVPGALQRVLAKFKRD